MMNLIQNELEDSEQFDFEHIENTGLVKLNRRNVALAEAMIRNNSRYNPKYEPTINRNGKETYAGSSKYWANKLSGFLNDSSQPINEKAYQEAMKKFCFAINKENSTRISSENLNRLVNKITKLDRKMFLKCLKDPEDIEHNRKNPYELIRILSENVGSSRKYHCRSFASKFCHYACFYLFENEEAQDNYSNYDSVVRETLIEYIEYLHLEKRPKKSLEDYATYQKCIDEIIVAASKDPEVSDKTGQKISRNGFDHLVWYSHK